jgi:acetolactate synthase-1/2/3 large subunit
VTSIGAGASNTVLGLATAYSDSTSVLVITGGPPRHMRGRGVLQELERQKDNGFPQIAEAVSKRSWVANSIEDLPFILHRAFSAMLTGRRGPAHVEVPWDLHAETAEVKFHDLARRLPIGLQYPDPEAITRAVTLLGTAKRPVIVVGGGAIMPTPPTKCSRWPRACPFRRHHLEWQERLPRRPRSVRGQRRPDRHHPRQLPGRQRRRRGVHRVPLHRLVSVELRSRTSFSFPPAKLIHIDIDPRDRQDLSRRGRDPRRRQARGCRDRRLPADQSPIAATISPKSPNARLNGRTSCRPRRRRSSPCCRWASPLGP